jgi:hypothetical protein
MRLVRLPTRGAVLADLLAALVLLGLLGVIAVRALVQQERVARAVLSRDQAELSLGAGLGFVRHELAELGRDTGSNDLTLVASDSLEYRAMRYAGLACEVSATQVLLQKDQTAGWRMPQPNRDSLLVLVGPDSGGVPEWIPGAVRSVGTGSCAGRPALALGTVLDTSRFAAPLPVLVPVRVFEIMQVRAYSSGGQRWLGAKSLGTGEAIQPVQGPLSSPGFAIAALDASGTPAASPGAVRGLRVGFGLWWTGWSLSAGQSGAADSATMVTWPGNLAP